MTFIANDNLKTETDREKVERIAEWWNSQPPISASLPIRLSNGSTVDNIAVRCGKCGEDVPDADLRGTITAMSLEDNSRHILDSVGWCEECRLYNPARYMIRTQAEGWAIEDLKWDVHLEATDGEVIPLTPR